jgi:hypothetical protein
LISINADKSALYSLGGINIHADNDRAFRSSCVNGHIEIVIFLLSLRNADKSASIDGKYDYIHTEDNMMTKLLFDHNIKLTEKLTDKYTAEKQKMISQMSEHLIPDIATMIYYYV